MVHNRWITLFICVLIGRAVHAAYSFYNRFNFFLQNVPDIFIKRTRCADEYCLVCDDIKRPFNVIADQAVLIGTARSFDENVRDILEKEIEAVVKGICSMHGASYEYTYEQGYPAVVNHPAETNHLVLGLR